MLVSRFFCFVIVIDLICASCLVWLLRSGVFWVDIMLMVFVLVAVCCVGLSLCLA